MDGFYKFLESYANGGSVQMLLLACVIIIATAVIFPVMI